MDTKEEGEPTPMRWRDELRWAWGQTPWLQWKDKAITAVVVAIVGWGALARWGTPGSVSDHWLTIVGTAIGAAILTPILRFLWNIWRAPLALRDEALVSLRTANADLGRRLEPYEGAERERRWWGELDRCRSRSDDFILWVDKVYAEWAEEGGLVVTNWEATANDADWLVPLIEEGAPALSTWVDDILGELTEEGATLWRFASDVFPRFSQERVVSLLGTDRGAWRAHWCRTRDDWNNLGRPPRTDEFWAYVDQVLRRTEANRVKLLAYFEVAHELSLAPTAFPPERQGLFMLARRWAGIKP